MNEEACKLERRGNVQDFTSSRESEALLPSANLAPVVRRSWRWRDISLFVCFWISCLIVSAAYSILAPFFPNEAEKKGATPLITGFIFGSSPLCVVILSPVFGYLLPHLGTRFTVLSGLLLIGGSFVLLGFVDQVPSGWMFIFFCILLRITEGIGSAMFSTATFTVLPILFPNSVGTVVSLCEVAGGLGFSVGPPLGGLLFKWGFYLPFVVVGGAVLLLILPCCILVKEISTESNSGSSQTPTWKIIAKSFQDLSFIVLVIGNILAVGCLSFFTPTLQPFLSKQFDFNSVQVGLVFLTGPLTYMICALFTGPLSDKFSKHRSFMVVGMFLYPIAFILIGPASFISTPRVWLTCVAFSLVGVAASFAIVPVFPDMLKILTRHLKEGESTVPLTAVVSGIVSSSFSFGEFLGPLVGGGLTSFLPFPMSSFVVGEVMVAEAFLLLGVTAINKYTSR